MFCTIFCRGWYELSALLVMMVCRHCLGLSVGGAGSCLSGVLELCVGHVGGCLFGMLVAEYWACCLVLFVVLEAVCWAF